MMTNFPGHYSQSDDQRQVGLGVERMLQFVARPTEDSVD